MDAFVELVASFLVTYYAFKSELAILVLFKVVRTLAVQGAKLEH